MIVERVLISSILGNPANFRDHGDRNVDAIKGSLAEFGQQSPLVVDRSGVVLKGNGTLIAAAALGWTELDVIRTELEGDRARAFALTDNRTSDLSAFDPAALAAELSALADGDTGIDLKALGFDETDYFAEPNEKESVGEPVKLVKHSVLPPPVMAWVLIGIPTVRFGEIARGVEAIAKVPGVLCETAASVVG